MKFKLFYRLLIVLILLSGCGIDKSTQPHNYGNFELIVSFAPSFDTPFYIRVCSYNHENTLTIAPMVINSPYWHSFNSLSLKIPEKEFNEFCDSIYPIDFWGLKDDRGESVDGISGSISYYNFQLAPRIVRFNCPDKGSDHINVIKQIFCFAEKLIMSEPHSSIIEDGTKYFNFNNGFRITNTNPYTIRFHEYMNKFDSLELSNTFKLIDNKKPVILDFTNIYDGNSILDTLIRNFILSGKNVYIVANHNPFYPGLEVDSNSSFKYLHNVELNKNEQPIKYLANLGIIKEKIYSNVDDVLLYLFKAALRDPNQIRDGEPVPVPEVKRKRKK